MDGGDGDGSRSGDAVRTKEALKRLTTALGLGEVFKGPGAKRAALAAVRAPMQAVEIFGRPPREIAERWGGERTGALRCAGPAVVTLLGAAAASSAAFFAVFALPSHFLLRVARVTQDKPPLAAAIFGMAMAVPGALAADAAGVAVLRATRERLVGPFVDGGHDGKKPSSEPSPPAGREVNAIGAPQSGGGWFGSWYSLMDWVTGDSSGSNALSSSSHGKSSWLRFSAPPPPSVRLGVDRADLVTDGVIDRIAALIPPEIAGAVPPPKRRITGGQTEIVTAPLLPGGDARAVVVSLVAIGAFLAAATPRKVRGSIPRGLDAALEGITRPYRGLGSFARIAPSDLFRKGAFAYDSVDVDNVMVKGGDGAYAGKTSRQMLLALGKTHGCHHCGTRAPESFIGDHIPPVKYAKQMPEDQRLWPQCGACSQMQSKAVRTDTRTLITHYRAVRAWKWAPGAAVGVLAFLDAGIPGALMG